MSDFNWTCPHCEHAVTISDERLSSQNHTLYIENAIGRRTLCSVFFVCPNPECRKFTLTVALHKSQAMPHHDRLLNKLQEWRLIPPSASKHFPDYVPQAIREDYGEACLIRDLSPKASATLSRRCLQGIRPRPLHASHVPETYQACRPPGGRYHRRKASPPPRRHRRRASNQQILGRLGGGGAARNPVCTQVEARRKVRPSRRRASAGPIACP